MNIAITSFYLGIFGLFYLALTIQVIRLRWKYRVGIGAGNHPEMEKAIRIHGNFSEFVPLILLMLACLEISGTNHFILHAIGSALLIARLAHLVGIKKSVGPSLLRSTGVVLTLLALLAAAVLLIVSSFN